MGKSFPKLIQSMPPGLFIQNIKIRSNDSKFVLFCVNTLLLHTYVCNTKLIQLMPYLPAQYGLVERSAEASGRIRELGVHPGADGQGLGSIL
jgi:hypothetical protein